MPLRKTPQLERFRPLDSSPGRSGESRVSYPARLERIMLESGQLLLVAERPPTPKSHTGGQAGKRAASRPASEIADLHIEPKWLRCQYACSRCLWQGPGVGAGGLPAARRDAIDLRIIAQFVARLFFA